MHHLVPAFILGVAAWLGALAAPAQADPLNPLDFASLGTQTIVAGAYTIDTGATPPTFGGFSGTVSESGVAVFRFDNLTVNAGAAITVTGGPGKRPVALLASGSLTFAGSVIARGSQGVNASGGGAIGGAPGAGSGGYGGAGGAGGSPGGFGGSGGGVGGGIGAIFFSQGGGGGGFGGAGGSASGGYGGTNGVQPNSQLGGGSGGGGGNGGAAGGGGGGGGGGAVELGALGTLNMVTNASISTDGGAGGAGVNISYSGGGGSGGAILLHGASVLFGTIGNSISAAGGASGGGSAGGGGGGRVAIQTAANNGASGIYVAGGGGTNGGAAGVITLVLPVLTPTNLDCGAVPVGSGVTVNMIIQNTGGAGSYINGQFPATLGAPFARVGTGIFSSLGQNAFAACPYTFTPTAIGPFSQNLAFLSNAGTVGVTISGTGVLPPTPTPSSCASSFAAAVNYGVGSGPRVMALGDLNGDGRLDVAVPNNFSNVVSVRLGNGDGTFAAAGNYSTGTGPNAAGIGDFDRDGRPDLAVSRGGSGGTGGVAILRGNGDGTFQAAVNTGAGGGGGLQIADFNGDGFLDLAVLNQGSQAVYIQLGQGNGTFLAPIIVSATGATSSWNFGVSDVNGDGVPDLAVPLYATHNVSVRLGNGDGTFAAAVNYGAGTNPNSVAMGDVNGDGKPDLAVANYGSANVSVLLGNGDGTFSAAVNYGAGLNPFWIAMGDVNGDGRLDLAVANYGSANVSVLLGKGDGTFGAAVNYGAGTNPFSVATGDLNGDGRLDLAVANQGSANVSVLLNNGTSIGFSPQPVSQAVTAGSTAVFTATATGTGPFSYQWRRNGVPLSNGGKFSGVTAATLTVTNVTAAEVGAYDVRVTGGCNGTIGATSHLAELRLSTPSTPADFDADGDVDLADFAAFQSCFNGPNQPPACP